MQLKRSIRLRPQQQLQNQQPFILQVVSLLQQESQGLQLLKLHGQLLQQVILQVIQVHELPLKVIQLIIQRLHL